MKKIIALLVGIVIAFAIVISLKFTCDLCGKPKYGKMHTVDNGSGKVTFCNECKKNPFGNVNINYN
jgi:hypothetical protein